MNTNSQNYLNGQGKTMPELSLQQAIFRGTSELNSNGLTFAPNPIALANDFEFSSNYSGAIALPSNSSKQPRHNGYEFVKLSTPNIKIPDTTLENLWECTKEHYGLTVFLGLAGTASIPIDKVKLGYWVQKDSRATTNIISHIGTRFFSLTRLPARSPAARLAKATFGTIRVFGIIGRAMPFVALGLAVFDVVSIGLCAYDAQNGK